MKRILLFALVMVMTLTTLTACTQTPATGDTTTKATTTAAAEDTVADDTSAADTEAETTAAAGGLSGSIVFATHMTNVADTTLRDLADAYEAANPGTSVEIEGIKDPENVLKTRMAANEAPDILGVLGSILKADYPKYYLPLDSLGFTKDDVSLIEGEDGKQYAFAFSVGYFGIIYNKQVFEKVGIDSFPTTPDELYDVCEKIKAEGIIPMSTNFKDVWPIQFYNIYYAYEQTGDVFFQNTIAQSDELYPEGSPMVKGMDILATLIDRGYCEPDLNSTNWDEYQKEMANGTMAMSYMVGGLLPQIAKYTDIENLGMFPFPEAKHMVMSNDWTYACSTDSKNQELALDFFKYLYTDSNYANAASVPTPLKNDKQPGFEWIDEFKAFGLPELFMGENDAFTTAVFNEYQVNWGAMVQEYVTASDRAGYIAEQNQRWADARATVTADSE